MRRILSLQEPWQFGFESCSSEGLDFAMAKNSALNRKLAAKIRAENWGEKMFNPFRFYINKLILDYFVEHFWVAANMNATSGFKWIDGVSVRSDAWAMGYPHRYESGVNQCVAMGSKTALLYNFDCQTKLSYVCFVPK